MTDSKRQPFHYYDIIMAIFVAVLLISNVASSAKIVDWGVSILGLRLAFDAGTILFPVSYIFGDVLTEVYGYRRSRRIIWIGFACSILMVGTLALVDALPAEVTWNGSLAVTRTDTGQVGGAALAFHQLLGPVWRIVLASLIAYFAGEFSNSYILAKMKVWTQGRWLWMRTIGSTIVGEGVDTALFVLIAFLGNPAIPLASLIVTNYFFKVGVEALMTPVTYRVVGALKRIEHEDYYDYHTDFNPFSLAGQGE